METLNVSGMVRNRQLSSSDVRGDCRCRHGRVPDQAGVHKCAWYGADFMRADRWFASSGLCAHCGWKNEGMNLSDRKWWCGGGGALDER